jgi:GNAT superfamily N-acetyltransferase
VTSAIELCEVPADDPDAAALSRALNAEADRRYGEAHDFGEPLPLGSEDPAYEAVVIAYVGAAAAGLGALRRLDPATAEIKRMIVVAEQRGKGIGRLILSDLERRARGLGCATVRLDSAALLTEAIDLYRTSGYREIPPYNDNPHAELWFEKRLSKRLAGVNRGRRPA